MDKSKFFNFLVEFFYQIRLTLTFIHWGNIIQIKRRNLNSIINFKYINEELSELFTYSAL